MLDDVQLRTQLGSARPYGAELGIPFDREVYPVELVTLIVAERLEVFFPANDVMSIMRWMSNFLAQLDIEREKPPEVVNVIDYRWIISLSGAGDSAWDTKTKTRIRLSEMAANNPPPEVSIAIDLHAIWLRRVRPMINQSRG